MQTNLKFFLVIILSIYGLSVAAPKLEKTSTPASKTLNKKLPPKELIDGLYQNITGFGIDAAEAKNINAQGGADTYGEITPESLQKLFDYLKLTKNDVFVDLGSGVGKTVVQAHLTTPAKKCVGVELSPTRHKNAQKVKEKIVKLKLCKTGQKLDFCEQNMLDADLKDATVVYTCSTCFSEDLMKKLVDKFSKLKPNLRVVTLKKLPDNEHFKLVETLNLPMTWTKETPVHIYKRTGKKVS